MECYVVVPTQLMFLGCAKYLCLLYTVLHSQMLKCYIFKLFRCSCCHSQCVRMVMIDTLLEKALQLMMAAILGK